MPPIARVLVVIFCAAAGYLAASTWRPSPPHNQPSADSGTDDSATAVKRAMIAPTENRLTVEWEQLRAQHGSSAEGMPTLYAAVKEIKDAFRRRAFRAALLAEWAGLDPKGALVFLRQKDRGNIGQLVREWLRLDPQAALDHLLATGDENRSTLRSVLDDVARSAPSRLAEVVTALGKPDHRTVSINDGGGVAFLRDTTTENAFALLAKKDLAEARVAAESVTGTLSGQALAGVAKTWAEIDGPAALAWGQSMPAGDARDAVLKAVLTGWAKNDPAAALERIDLVPPGGHENYYASDIGAQVLREAAKKDWERTVEWLRAHPGKLGRSSLDGLQAVLSERLNRDPGGTLSSLAQSGVGGLEGVLANAFLNEGYAKRDAVWQWLDDQPASDFTRATRASVLNAIAWKEPDKALGYLDKIPDTPENRQLLEQGTRSVINGGSQMNRFEELLSKASPKIRPLLLEAGFQFGGRNAGADAARWTQRLSELPSERQANAVGSLASGWAQVDPEAAIQWALSLPDAGQRDRALQNATGTWAAADPYEASAWINSLPAGKDRDIATRNLVGALSAAEPETAWTWALSIGSSEQRRSALELAYMGMVKKDAALARNFLQSSDLPAEQKSALLKQFSGGSAAHAEHLAR